MHQSCIIKKVTLLNSTCVSEVGGQQLKILLPNMKPICTQLSNI